MSEKDHLLAELPVGKLSGVRKVSKDSSGKETITLSYKASTGDLHAWEQREFGIDDNLRTAIVERNKALEKMVSDFAADTFEKHPETTDIEVGFGIGNGAENFRVIGCKTSFYPKKNDDGTVERAEKTTYGVMQHTTRQKIEKDVREYHAPNQSRIEAAITATMNKTSLK